MVMNCTSKQKTEHAPINTGVAIIRVHKPVATIGYPRVVTLRAGYFIHWNDSGDGREVRTKRERWWMSALGLVRTFRSTKQSPAPEVVGVQCIRAAEATFHD